tara:strand:+ start:1581 stop:1832 length:252 start_codon:yes stop_codon:yes gene_type:complete
MENYKTIKLTMEECVTTETVIELFLRQEEESLKYFKEKLECPDSPTQAKQYLAIIADNKRRIKTLKPLLARITEMEYTIKHTL